MDERSPTVETLRGIRARLARVRRWRETGAGQSLVEFGLIMPLLLILLFGLCDFGRAFYSWLVVTNAAREGARVGAVQGDTSAINTRIQSSASGITLTNLTITLTNVQGSRGTPVEVDLSYTFNFVTPIGGILQLMGGSSLSAPTITAHASMRLE